MTLILYKYAQPNNAPSVYGSKQAAQFLQDLLSGRDSLDVVTIGDSNTGHPGGSTGYGYTAGLFRALQFFGGQSAYATPLTPGNISGGSAARTAPLWGAGYSFLTSSDGEAGNTGTVRTLYAAATQATPDSDAFALKNNLGIDMATYNDNGSNTTRLPKFGGYEWHGGFVASGVTYTSAANKNLIELGTTNEMNLGNGDAGTSLQYRVVYGKFGGGSGQFKPTVWSTAGSTVASSWVPTSGGSAGNWYATAPGLNFTSNKNGSSVVAYRCSWDGLGQGGSVTGPFACLWHSIIRRSFKGFAVNNLIYDGGKSTAQIADRVEAMDQLLDAYLKELRERQQEAGGSGRVLVFVNTGINGPDSSTTWPTAAARIVQRIKDRWATTLGLPNNLAFVFSVTHPTTNTGSWETPRSSVSNAANSWATENAGSNISVVDIAQNYPSNRLLNGTAPAGSLYDGGGQAHLSYSTTTQLNGYDAVAGSIVSSLLASV